MTDAVDPARSFGQVAGAYDRSRPDYPAEAVDWMLDGVRGRVADVGAGTGKLTRALAKRGDEVVAIDPDPKMLAELSQRISGVETVVGTGEALPLADASVDAVTYAQAWHWVDPVRASAEAGRVLRPGGVLGLIWNIRDASVPWVAELAKIMGDSRAEVLLAAQGPVVADPFGALERVEVAWTRRTGVDGLVRLVSSRSAIIMAETDRRNRILDAVRDLGHSVARRGVIEIPYITSAFRAISPS